MNKVVLFIRDHETRDILDYHPDEVSAQKALAAYVTLKTGQALPSDPAAASRAIAAYYNPDQTFYTIAGIAAGVNR